jgi:hypothetical protein
MPYLAEICLTAKYFWEASFSLSWNQLCKVLLCNSSSKENIMASPNNVVSETQGFSNRIGDYSPEIQQSGPSNWSDRWELTRGMGVSAAKTTGRLVKKYPMTSIAIAALIGIGLVGWSRQASRATSDF